MIGMCRERESVDRGYVYIGYLDRGYVYIGYVDRGYV